MTVLDKLRSFGDRPEGWHYGEGDEFTSAILECAEAVVICGQLLGLDEVNVFPGLSGEVLVAFYRSGHCIEVEVDAHANQRFAVSLESPDGEQTDPVEFGNLEQMKNELKRLKDSMCLPTSAYSEPSTSTSKEIDFSAWLSDPQAVAGGEGSQFLTTTALAEPRTPPALISRSGTRMYLGNRQFYGGSQKGSYPMRASA